mgnify:CR=1 FL=1
MYVKHIRHWFSLDKTKIFDTFNQFISFFSSWPLINIYSPDAAQVLFQFFSISTHNSEQASTSCLAPIWVHVFTVPSVMIERDRFGKWNQTRLEESVRFRNGPTFCCESGQQYHAYITRMRQFRWGKWVRLLQYAWELSSLMQPVVNSIVPSVIGAVNPTDSHRRTFGAVKLGVQWVSCNLQV